MSANCFVELLEDFVPLDHIPGIRPYTPLPSHRPHRLQSPNENS